MGCATRESGDFWADLNGPEKFFPVAEGDLELEAVLGVDDGEGAVFEEEVEDGESKKELKRE